MIFPEIKNNKKLESKLKGVVITFNLILSLIMFLGLVFFFDHEIFNFNSQKIGKYLLFISLVIFLLQIILSFILKLIKKIMK